MFRSLVLDKPIARRPLEKKATAEIAYGYMSGNNHSSYRCLGIQNSYINEMFD